MGRDVRRPKRSVATGCLLRTLGVLVVVAILGGSMALLERIDLLKGARDSIGRTLMLFVIPAILFYFLAAARKREAKSADRVLEEDPRPPVLYLRCFDDDLSAAAMTMGLTEEEALAKVMHELGPFVAIGRPGERLPELGASRMYVDDDEWQKRVRDLMKRSRLVVMRIGSAVGGFHWELKTAKRLLQPEQVVLVVPNNPATYAAFCDQAESLLRVTLPSIDFSKFRGRCCGVITFQADGNAEFHPLTSKRMRRSLAGPMVAEFKYALRRVFARAGVSWSPPPVSTFRVVKAVYLGVVLLALAGGALFLAWVYFTGQWDDMNW